MTYLVGPEPDALGPRVHALVIGVAGYRHLPGGDEPVARDTIVRRQLYSPASSALAFAEWVRDEMRHPDAALGTIDVLISPPVGSPDPRLQGWEVPSVDATVAAIDRWADLCGRNPGNVALFFFSGHGIALRRQLLLLEDFARSPSRRCDAAIALEDLVAGMSRYPAETQYFFIDACREIPTQLLPYDTATAPVLDAQITAEPRKEWGVVSSTRMGFQAFGNRQGLSVFTEHLLASLNGRAARKKDSRWAVSFTSLHESLSFLTGDASPAGREPQFPESRLSGNRPLHLLPGPPWLEGRVCCCPAKATAAADVRIASASSAGKNPATVVFEDPWWTARLTAGVHEVSLGFVAGDYEMHPPPPKYIAFEPFDCDHTIDVRGTG